MEASKKDKQIELASNLHEQEAVLASHHTAHFFSC
jgi:hypothetical protein